MPEPKDDPLPGGMGEYLEAIFRLGGSDRSVPVPALAEHLGVAGASANEMVRRLAERGLATYEPYKGVVLTEEGRLQAVTVVRRHRLWERFLTDVLGMPWDEVHQEACRLEHATSPQLEERLSRALAGSTSCPHGQAVPGPDGTLVEPEVIPLSDLSLGQEATVEQVPEENPALLRYLDDLGLRPGREVKLVAAEPFAGPLTLVMGEETRLLGHGVAEQIGVRVKEARFG
ncbi:MAG: metal-dependent transcriptional regulator [Anaerolineae bacterium]|nr:metal-dependent transcriptional regulator [Anaerolineae bacterium]